MTVLKKLTLNKEHIPICPNCDGILISGDAVEYERMGNGRSRYVETFYCEFCDEQFEYNYTDRSSNAKEYEDDEHDEPRDRIHDPKGYHFSPFI